MASQQLKISTEEAKDQMDQYFARFGGVRDYLLDVVEQARRGQLHLDSAGSSAVPAGVGQQ